MNIDNIKLQTTWNEAAQSLNTNFTAFVIEIEKLKLNQQQGGRFLCPYPSPTSSFATKAALLYGPWYYGNSTTSLRSGDYAFVTADEDHDGKSSRYVVISWPASYGSNVRLEWVFVGELNFELSNVQIAAINSGITNSKREGYDAAVTNLNVLDQNVHDILFEHLPSKVDKVSGKGLSTNDYSNSDKAKVDSLQSTYVKKSGDDMTGKLSILGKDVLTTEDFSSKDKEKLDMLFTDSLKGCVAFYSEAGNPVTIACASPAWDGKIEYSFDRRVWFTWNGEAITGTTVYMRGEKITIFGATINAGYFEITCATNDVHSEGYLWDLRDYTRTAKMVQSYQYLFQGNTCLKTALNISEDNLRSINSVFAFLYENCTNLEYTPPIEIKCLRGSNLVFYNTFKGCNLKNLPEIKVYDNCDTLCYGMFQGNHSIKMSSVRTDEYCYPYKIPDVVGDRCFEMMFYQCGGTYTDTPYRGQVLYTSNKVVENPVVVPDQSEPIDMAGLMYMSEAYRKMADKAQFTSVFNNDQHIVYLPMIRKTPTSSAAYMCQQAYNLHLADISGITGLLDHQSMFFGCKSLRKVTYGTMTPSQMANFARWCSQLEEFVGTSIDFADCANVNYIFGGCPKLTKIEGEWSNIKLDMSISESPLTAESAMVVINGLYDYSGDSDVHTLTLHATTKALLTDEQKQVAYDKNWTIA